ncbi:MAG TPA: ABC transporter permease [Vicinamibacterales bacterium]|nr:ABC transporter permease [Vicinamibacterales bacterium]
MRALVACLLWLFPPRFRHRFGPDLIATFDDRWRDDGGGWRRALRTVADLLRAAAAEWRSTLRARPSVSPEPWSIYRRSSYSPSRTWMMPNFRLAFRSLVKTPLVTTVAVCSLALGIGANTAIFSLFDKILLRPLPVSAPDDLVNLAAPGPKPGSTSCGPAGTCDIVFSYPMFHDLEQRQTVFTGIAAHAEFDATFAYDGEATTGQGIMVSGSYFPVLGLQPALGRLLAPSDDAVDGEPHAVVVAHDFWQARFASNPDMIGRTMLVNGVPLTIVGVAPMGFHGTTKGATPLVFAPVTLRGLLQPFSGHDVLNDRRWYWLFLFARVRPGVSIDQARTAINQPYHEIITSVDAPLQTGMSDETLARFKAKRIVVTPGARGQSRMETQARAPLTFLLALTAMVLLIACANIANLLLARSVARRGEMAIRLSIGASRRHLVIQLLTESCLIGVIGAALGLGVAYGTLAALQSLLPMALATPLDVRIDPTMLGFAAVLAVGTGLLFGLFPAIHSTRPDLVPALKNQAGQPSGGRTAGRFRAGLVTAQITLSMLLLVGAGLFTKSLVKVSRVDLGIDVEHLVTFGIAPSMNGYTASRSRAVFDQVEEGIRALPGVTSASAAAVPLVAGNDWGTSVVVRGFDAGPDTDIGSEYNLVDTDFFRTAGMPMMAGRDFTRADVVGAPKVAIVNEAFVRKFKLGQAAVGEHLRQGTLESDGPFDMEIVGVVRDAAYSDIKDVVPPVLYTPYRQDSRAGAAGTFYVRTLTDPDTLVHAIPEVIHRIDPNLPVDALRTMPQQVSEDIAVDRMLTTLAGTFAALATILAGIGLYGVLAYTVSQRTREFGLRMALGATPPSIARLVLGQVARMTIVGAAAGTAAALLAGRSVGSLLFHMEGRDVTVTAGALALLVLVAAIAGWIPAVRASRTDPMRALRQE